MIITRPRGLGCQKVNRQPGGPSEPERSSDLIFALWSLAYMPVLSKGSRLGAPAHVGVSAISPFDLGGEVHSNRMTLQYAGRRTLARMDTSLAAATLLIVVGMIGMLAPSG